MVSVRIIVGVILAVVVSSHGLPANDVVVEDQMGANMKFMMKIYQDCSLQQGGVMPCLKKRAITFFDRVSKLDTIPLMESVSLVQVQGEDRTSRALTETELEASLPQDIEQRDDALSNLLTERVARFFSSHTIQVALPQVSEGDLARGLEDGRGKMKKMMGMMMMMGGAMKFGLLMLLKLKGLFFLAKKALIISKIALVLALITILRKVMGGGGASSSGHGGGWSSGGGGGYSSGSSSGGWDRRALESAHDMAYGAQKPVSS